jgi:hypothetical protein
MKITLKLAVVTGALALSAAPALAVGSQPSSVPPANQGTSHAPGQTGNTPNGQGHGPDYTPANPTPGPKAGLPAKAKAYGRYCKGESKKHVKGEKGTPFSQCVTAMAKVAHNDNLNPRRACKDESRKHVKGEKGTPFSRCVSAAAKLRHAQQG